MLTGSINRLAKLAAGLPPSASPKMVDDAFQPCRPARPGRENIVTEPFSKNLPPTMRHLTNEPPRDHPQAYLLARAPTHFLENYPGLSAAASSAFLGHAPPLDEKDPEARSPTTEKFYSVTQRMPLKTLAMKAWSESVLSAYLKAGGVWPPRPYEAPVKKYYRTKRIGES
jgi:hypothetical protein